jgi:hypothetical protein
VLTHAGYAKHAQVHCTLRVIGDGSGWPIEWFEAVDGYCKRVDATFLPEPINMVTHAAFLIAAIWALIGIGSFLFHTFAQTWAGLADVLPILMFILIYMYVTTRNYFQVASWGAWLSVIGFFPVAAVIGWLISDWGNLGSTRGYVPVPILILIYAYL